MDSIDISNIHEATPKELSDFGAGAGAKGHCFDVTVKVSARQSSGGPCTLGWMEYGIVQPLPGSSPTKGGFHGDEMIGTWANMYRAGDAMFQPWESAFATTDCPNQSIKITDCPSAAVGTTFPGGKATYSQFERWLFIVLVARSGCPECPSKVAWFKQYVKVTGGKATEGWLETVVEEPIRAQGGESYIPPGLPTPGIIGGIVGPYAR